MQWEDQNPRLSSSGGSMYDYMVSQDVFNLNAWMPTFNTGGGGGESPYLSTSDPNAIKAFLTQLRRDSRKGIGSGTTVLNLFAGNGRLKYYTLWGDGELPINNGDILGLKGYTGYLSMDGGSYGYGSLENTESSTDWAAINKGLAGFGFGNGIKNQMMDYAIRGKFSDVEFKALNDFGQNRKLLETLGKGGTKYLKYAKNLGTIAEIGNVLYSGYQMYNNPTAGNSTRLAVQGITIGTAFIPGVGWAISLGIGTADAIWGDQLYNWIDNH